MGFTASCFIRKNTPQLREKLQELGYKTTFRTDFEYIKINEPKANGIYRTTYCPHATTEQAKRSGFIDCGENEQLFIALAALRDDSDKEQIFVNGKGGWAKFQDHEELGGLKGLLFFSLFSDMCPDNYHKASKEELLELIK